MPVRADGLPGTAEHGYEGDPAPPPGLVVLGHFDQPPGYVVNRPRGSASWLFTWTTAGRGRLWQGGVETSAGAGRLVVLAPGVPHGYAVGPGARHWRFWWAHCQARPSWPGWLRPYDAGDGVYVVTSAPAGVHGRVEAAFRRMHADARRPGAGAPPDVVAPDGQIAVAHGSAARELALCALEEIVLLTTAGARPAAPRPGLDARIQRAQELIDADPGAPHTVRSLAEQVSLSPSRFAHLFSRQLGRSPMRALREARLRHAARLLEGTDLPVERVAAASGFASPFHFNRVFRERYGTPPGAYRNAVHGGRRG
ncbi:helix-turn-helix domain-containing protein [Streptomyces coeruleorubidus]|uniref:Helix-turn-helix domain-containing protein n=1 Tax=Streptomyces coeruleorubidus TaxID=116188 RepID=A0A5J6IBF2_STRC4|nr:helix-turn-helix domain-containing protein [Streptomyces coeruleorubidus]QEV29529.1 helix-turn-helix domain-containing protein [Streptomyces coeruleorubidus]